MDEKKTPPESFFLLCFGMNTYTKDGKNSDFVFTPETAEMLIEEFDKRGRDLVIDYEHQTLTGEKAPAATWIDSLTQNSEGLSAHVRYWTRKAADLLQSGEYRYFSPVLLFAQAMIRTVAQGE